MNGLQKTIIFFGNKIFFFGNKIADDHFVFNFPLFYIIKKNESEAGMDENVMIFSQFKIFREILLKI